jgi:hypothetical protein
VWRPFKTCFYFEYAEALGTELNHDAQADSRGATQVFSRGCQAVAGGSSLSQVLYSGAQAVARGAVPCVLQILGRGVMAVSHRAARCLSRVLDRGPQPGA